MLTYFISLTEETTKYHQQVKIDSSSRSSAKAWPHSDETMSKKESQL